MILKNKYLGEHKRLAVAYPCSGVMCGSCGRASASLHGLLLSFVNFAGILNAIFRPAPKFRSFSIGGLVYSWCLKCVSGSAEASEVQAALNSLISAAVQLKAGSTVINEWG
ncbi:hypothetical protein VN23_17240 [Janthinobacterium sp. B9-8]|nr:hypothetical protein VN23_17240 [Janthinobacterium sp. B9-8]